MVTDHGSANLAGSTLDYLTRHHVEILPALPTLRAMARLKGAFSEMAEVIGAIHLRYNQSSDAGNEHFGKDRLG